MIDYGEEYYKKLEAKKNQENYIRKSFNYRIILIFLVFNHSGIPDRQNVIVRSGITLKMRDQYLRMAHLLILCRSLMKTLYVEIVWY